MFEELEAFVMLADTGSMSRAARGLSLTASAFSRRIQRLESELGIAILDRNFKPPRLTPAGQEVLQRGRLILASVRELKRSASNAPSGPFRLGLSHALAQPDLAGALLALGRRFPLLAHAHQRHEPAAPGPATDGRARRGARGAARAGARAGGSLRCYAGSREHARG